MRKRNQTEQPVEAPVEETPAGEVPAGDEAVADEADGSVPGPEVEESAEAPEPAPQPVAKSGVVAFISRSPNQRLIKEPQGDQIRDQYGRVIAPGTPSVAAEFIDNRFETSDPEIIEWLRGHRLHGIAFREDAQG